MSAAPLRVCLGDSDSYGIVSMLDYSSCSSKGIYGQVNQPSWSAIWNNSQHDPTAGSVRRQLSAVIVGLEQCSLLIGSKTLHFKIT